MSDHPRCASANYTFETPCPVLLVLLIPLIFLAVLLVPIILVILMLLILFTLLKFLAPMTPLILVVLSASRGLARPGARLARKGKLVFPLILLRSGSSSSSSSSSAFADPHCDLISPSKIQRCKSGGKVFHRAFHFGNYEGGKKRQDGGTEEGISSVPAPTTPAESDPGWGDIS